MLPGPTDAVRDEDMKICHVLNTVGTGGAETFVLELVRQTASADLSFTVCYLGRYHRLAPRFERAGARVVDLGARTDTPQFDPAVVPKFVETVRRGEFDVLHAHMPFVSVLARLVGNGLGDCAVVSTQHTPRETLPTPSRVATTLTRSLDDATVAVSDGVARSFSGAASPGYPWATADRRLTIPNGIDVDAFNEDVRAAAPVESFESASPVFLNVGRYVPEKGQQHLVDAMARVRAELPDAHAVVVGFGPLEDDLRARVRAAGLDDAVTITGKSTDVAKYYAQADAFVLSSEIEGLPVVGLEAMAAELPVVGTRVPGVEDVVEDGTTGYLVPPQAPDRLAEAMIAVGSDADRRRMGRRGFERARTHFDIERTTAAYLDLYRSLAGGGGP